MTETTWQGPLAGIRVLDFTRVLAGPFATQVLSDLGAEVIKLEPPADGDLTRHYPPYRGGESHYFISVNRGKRSLVVDLRKPEGKEIALALAAKSDVVVENYRPGVLDRLGLGYEALSAVNPGLIYCAISGFGLSGPMRDRPSFDIVTQALTGAMSVNGEPGRPPVKLGLPMGDLGGGLFAAVGVLAALHERHATGRGRLIDISLQDGLLGLLAYLPQLGMFQGVDPGPIGSGHNSIVPYNSYVARDGSVLIACLTTVFFASLCTAIGQPELALRPEFAAMEGRYRHKDEIDGIIAAFVAQHSVAEMLELLERHDIPHAPVLTISQALAEPHVQARGMVETVDHPTAGPLTLVGRPVRFPGSPQPPLRRPDLLGEATRDVLAEAGYDAERIARLERDGVVHSLPENPA